MKGPPFDKRGCLGGAAATVLGGERLMCFGTLLIDGQGSDSPVCDSLVDPLCPFEAQDAGAHDICTVY